MQLGVAGHSTMTRLLFLSSLRLAVAITREGIKRKRCQGYARENVNVTRLRGALGDKQNLSRELAHPPFSRRRTFTRTREKFPMESLSLSLSLPSSRLSRCPLYHRARCSVHFGKSRPSARVGRRIGPQRKRKSEKWRENVRRGSKTRGKCARAAIGTLGTRAHNIGGTRVG